MYAWRPSPYVRFDHRTIFLFKKRTRPRFREAVYELILCLIRQQSHA